MTITVQPVSFDGKPELFEDTGRAPFKPLLALWQDKKNMGFKRGFCIQFGFKIAQDPQPRTVSQRDPFNKDCSIYWPFLQASASSRLQSPTDDR